VNRRPSVGLTILAPYFCRRDRAGIAFSAYNGAARNKWYPEFLVGAWRSSISTATAGPTWCSSTGRIGALAARDRDAVCIVTTATAPAATRQLLSASECSAAGVQFVSAPRDEPYGLLTVFLNLEGNRWDLLRPEPGVPIGQAAAP
jgi:hypothetical protein